MYKKPVVESVDLQFEKPMCLASPSDQFDPAPARGGVAPVHIGALEPNY